jgi:hypothetical protein
MFWEKNLLAAQVVLCVTLVKEWRSSDAYMVVRTSFKNLEALSMKLFPKQWGKKSDWWRKSVQFSGWRKMGILKKTSISVTRKHLILFYPFDRYFLRLKSHSSYPDVLLFWKRLLFPCWFWITRKPNKGFFLLLFLLKSLHCFVVKGRTYKLIFPSLGIRWISWNCSTICFWHKITNPRMDTQSCPLKIEVGKPHFPRSQNCVLGKTNMLLPCYK